MSLCHPLFSDLKRNILANRIEDIITLHNAAVGSETSTSRFTKYLDSVNLVILDDKNQSQDLIGVPVFSLNSKIKNNFSVIFLKIDVEGYETQVLKSISN